MEILFSSASEIEIFKIVKFFINLLDTANGLVCCITYKHESREAEKLQSLLTAESSLSFKKLKLKFSDVFRD